MMRNVLRRLLFASLVALGPGCGDDSDSTPAILGSVHCARPAEWDALTKSGLWDDTIEAYERADADDPPAPGAIVFIGSSSIALWTTAARDMAPLQVVNRGFGGSVMTQATGYVDRIVLPYQPRAVVLYEGDNDITFGLSTDCVLEDYDAFVAAIHATRPEVPIYFLSIKPSVARAALWPEMERANALIEARASTDRRLHYVDVASSILDENGEAHPELFIKDGLHLNRDGYAAWTSVLRPILLAHFQ